MATCNLEQHLHPLYGEVITRTLNLKLRQSHLHLRAKTLNIEPVKDYEDVRIKHLITRVTALCCAALRYCVMLC